MLSQIFKRWKREEPKWELPGTWELINGHSQTPAVSHPRCSQGGAKTSWIETELTKSSSCLHPSSSISSWFSFPDWYFPRRENVIFWFLGGFYDNDCTFNVSSFYPLCSFSNSMRERITRWHVSIMQLYLEFAVVCRRPSLWKLLVFSSVSMPNCKYQSSRLLELEV